MAATHKKWGAPKTVPGFLTALPGEIRNQIFEYCILEAFNSVKSKRIRLNTFGGNTYIPSRFTINALPLWSGPSLIRMNGIGSLPLLFANHQIHLELSSLLYSMVDELAIGGYAFQFPGEDPSIRWNGVYPLLERRSNLQKFTKNVTVSLPSPREKLTRGHWRSLGFSKPPPNLKTAGYRPWVVVPGLIKFLSTFSALKTLQIVITMDKPEPPDFEDLLPLWDICGEKSTMTMRTTDVPNIRDWTLQWPANWEAAWKECLVKNRKIEKEQILVNLEF